MVKLRNILFIFLVFIFQDAFARKWQEIKIPGAYCGNGEAYSVFLDNKSNENLVVEFMSGGACWDKDSCLGPNFRTWLRPASISQAPSILADENDPENLFAHHSYLYFPYCTGDVFSGKSVAFYKKGLPTFHYGRTNILRALEYLSEKKLIQFSEIRNVLSWGVSAGAIGSLAHVHSLDLYLSKSNINKVVIADSPGLHFGENFFDKFSDSYFLDLFDTFNNVNLYINRDKGLIADSLPEFYYSHPDWQIGILQSTKDVVMSAIFGNISPQEHSKLVLGPYGFLNVSQFFNNAHTWSRDSYVHSFLLYKKTASLKGMNRSVTALDFVNQVYLKASGQSH